MLLQTLGHATLSLRRGEDEAPILITDPWVKGSCYWRSWWLQRYPSPAQVESLRRAAFCYLTHEHPDHFHPPSLRSLGRQLPILTPDFNRDQMAQHLRGQGFSAETLKAGQLRSLTTDVRVMSMPTIGNDSLLLIDTPHALIINANDARPGPLQLATLRRLRRRMGRDKPCILLASYSAAGLANSFYRNGTRVPFLEQGWHARYIAMLCRTLNVDVYLPFASQVTFERPDTRWAMDFQVRVDDVRAELARHGVKSCPPHVTYDLRTGEWVTEDDTPALREDGIEERVAAQLSRERRVLDSHAIQRLESKLRAAGGPVLPVLFPRGIGFDFGAQRMKYETVRGRIVEGDASGSIRLRLPAHAVCDVLDTGYLSDLCIPMFTHVDLAPEVPAASVYILFTLIQMHDVGATASLQGFARWASVTANGQLRSLRAA